jgi:hypothetical protein
MKIPSKVLRLRLDNSEQVAIYPSKFCELYLRLDQESWGYRQRACQFLSEVLNIPETTILRWWRSESRDFDNCPQYVISILKREHTIRQIRALLERE